MPKPISNLLCLTLRRTVSPLKSWSSSILAMDRATTELSSLTASSTIRRLGRFFWFRIAVANSSLKTRK